jgi:hypothetical protein
VLVMRSWVGSTSCPQPRRIGPSAVDSPPLQVARARGEHDPDSNMPGRAVCPGGQQREADGAIPCEVSEPLHPPDILTAALPVRDPIVGDASDDRRRSVLMTKEESHEASAEREVDNRNRGPRAHDGGRLPVSCTLRSGSLFAVGRTKVTCSATDSSGKHGPGPADGDRFTVTVKRGR